MILVTGSLAFDQIMDFPGVFSDHILPDKLHILNVSFLVDKMRRGFGGTAGNIAYSLSLLGVKCSVLGLGGEDFAPYREFLEKSDIDTSGIKIISGLSSSSAFGITDSSDNQIWGYYMGVDSFSDSLSVKEISGKIDLGIIAPQNPRAMLKFAKEYRDLKVPYLFDPGMQLPRLDSGELVEALDGAKIIIGNDYEVSLMEKMIRKPLSRFSEKGTVVITTLGSAGSSIQNLDRIWEVPPAKVKNASDPAGAGDAFRAGFIAGYLRKFPLDVCGRMGSVASAYSVEKHGTTTHAYSLKEFNLRYGENFGSDLPL